MCSVYICNGLEIIIEIPDKKSLLEMRQISLKMISNEPMNVMTRERKKKLLRRFTD